MSESPTVVVVVVRSVVGSRCETAARPRQRRLLRHQLGRRPGRLGPRLGIGHQPGVMRDCPLFDVSGIFGFFSVSLQEGEAGRAREGAADRAEYYRRNRQAVADPVVVRRRPHSRSKTEGRLCSESSIGANMSRRNICRRRTRPICQNQIGRQDNSSSSCPAGADPAGRAGLRLQLQD